MRHHQNTRILSRSAQGRTTLLRSLAISLIEYGKISTTEAKAKELRPFIERLVTYGKRNTLAARRAASQKLGEPKGAVVQKLFDEIAKNYESRSGGYTRITKTGRTPAGRAEAVIEFV